jgi:hypothetical protein
MFSITSNGVWESFRLTLISEKYWSTRMKLLNDLVSVGIAPTYCTDLILCGVDLMIRQMP